MGKTHGINVRAEIASAQSSMNKLAEYLLHNIIDLHKATGGIHTTYESVILSILFFAVGEYVMYNSGGDGDGWFISENWKSLAEKFEQCEQAGRKWFLSKQPYGDGRHGISFFNDHEAIHFIESRSGLPVWRGDIVVEL